MPALQGQLLKQGGGAATPAQQAAQQGHSTPSAGVNDGAKEQAQQPPMPAPAQHVQLQQGGEAAPAAQQAAQQAHSVPSALDTLGKVLTILETAGTPDGECSELCAAWLLAPADQRAAVLHAAAGAARHCRQQGGTVADRILTQHLSEGQQGRHTAGDYATLLQLQQVMEAAGLPLDQALGLEAAWLLTMSAAQRSSIGQAMLRRWRAVAGHAVEGMCGWKTVVGRLATAAWRSMDLAAAGAGDLHPRLQQMQGWFAADALLPPGEALGHFALEQANTFC